MSYGSINVDTITGSGASSVIVNNGSANVCGFTTGNNLQMLQNGGGIVFSNSSATTNSTLNDYETGTWTPTVGGTATYTLQAGYYTKIGNVVSCQFRIQINAIGTGSTTTISGFPFTAGTSANSVNAAGNISYYASGPTGIYWISGQMAAGNSNMSFITTTSAQTTINNVPAVMTSGTTIICQVTYQANF